VNCCCEPFETEGEAGVIAIETRVAGVTVNCVEPLTLPSVAEIVVVPTLNELARPGEPGALLMVATPVLAEPQVTVVLKFCVDPSEYDPVAANCFCVPFAMLVMAGTTVIETSVLPVTVRVAEPLFPPSVAEIVVDPAMRELATPFVPALLSIDAMPVSEEIHVTLVVTFCVVLSV